MATAVKICGITRPEDALAAARAGAHAIGLVFYPGSSRFVTPGRASEIIRVLPPFVTTVGLFVDAQADTVRATLSEAPNARRTPISRVRRPIDRDMRPYVPAAARRRAKTKQLPNNFVIPVATRPAFRITSAERYTYPGTRSGSTAPNTWCNA